MRLLLILIFIISFGFVVVTAQNPNIINDPKTLPPAKAEKFAQAHSQIKSNLPFQTNEQLSYELRLSLFPIYGTIGTLTFTVNDEGLSQPKENIPPIEKKAEEKQSERDKPINTSEATAINTNETTSDNKANNQQNVVEKKVENNIWKFTVEAKSKGILTSIFRKNINDVFTSYVNKNDFNITKTIKKIEEGNKRREMVSDFDQIKQKVKWIDTDLNTQKVVRSKENPTLIWVTDIINGWYVMRAQELTVGKIFAFPLNDEGETYEIEVAVLAKEKLETDDFGKFSTIKLDMKIFNGKYIRRKGTLHLWVTDDSRHIPLRAQIKTGFGTVTANLIEMKNIKSL
ncbi:MAG: hypothetical protein FD167_2023 [bacterium]|nr:MAG: hypothetical protein FD167_2023 [bacterium]